MMMHMLQSCDFVRCHMQVTVPASVSWLCQLSRTQQPLTPKAGPDQPFAYPTLSTLNSIPTRS
ncbi:hypothetical protein E2C01_035250 [Portunus trituberculatus]|uniref:Uncharacterized protein n=1 Tax=Portunus trituberculatus TaxID=210409 RepID=A0A5B7F2Q0_PORTR|nr:hypothetical protein [Portunus trituberculatus]